MTAFPDTLPEALDPESPAFRRAASRRWWFLAGVLVIAPLTLFVVGVLALVIWLYAQYSVAYRQVEREVQRIQAAGEPITVRDLHAYHRPKSGVNDTTELWLAALGSFDEQQFHADGKPLPVVGESNATAVTSADLTVAEEFLAKYDQTVQLALTAAKTDGECRFPVQYEMGFSALLPNAQKMRTLSRLMQLRGRVAAAKGNAEQSVESIEAQFGVSRAMSHQLLLIEHLIRLATATVALREIESLLNGADSPSVQLNEEQLARLARHIEALDFQDGLHESLMGERAMGYHAFHHMEQISVGNLAGPANPPNPGDGNLVRPADCALYLGFLRDMAAASKESFPAALDGAQATEKRIQLLAGSQNPLEKYNAMVTLLVVPATTKSFEATGRNLALREAVRSALAVERHRLAHGTVPAKLAESAPEFLPAVPTDPFDGQPIRMADKGDALLFYSVGKDRKDDGGAEKGSSGEPDVVVRLRKRP